MFIYYFLFVLAIILLCAFLYFRVNEKREIALIIKALTTTTLIILALNVYRDFDSLAYLILIGLIFSLVGDIVLDLKYIFSELDFPLTVFGLISFGITHFFYITYLLKRYNQMESYFLFIAIGIAFLCGILMLVLEKPMKNNYSDYKPIILAYSTILSYVLILSIILLIKYFSPAILTFTIGIILFFASDIILSNTYFGQNKDGKIYIILNHALYYIAQGLIIISMLL